MTQRARLRSTVLLGVLLSVPAYQTWSDGGIELDTLAIRVAVAVVVAYVAVRVVAGVLEAYAPTEGPPVEEDATADEVEALPLEEPADES